MLHQSFSVLISEKVVPVKCDDDVKSVIFMQIVSLRAPTVVCGCKLGVDSTSVTYAPRTTVEALKIANSRIQTQYSQLNSFVLPQLS